MSNRRRFIMRKIYVRLHDSNIMQMNKIPMKKLLKWLLVSVVVFLFLSSGVIYGYVTSLVIDEPIRSNEEIRTAIEDNNITGYVYFDDSSLVGELQSGENRRLTTIE